MRKSLFKVLIGCVGFVFLTTQCSKNDTATISGKVSMEDASAAAGAVVYLSTTANAANITATSVADADGAYAFAGIEEGTYYVTSVYNNNNTNLKAGELDMIFETAADVEVTIGKKAEDVTKDITVVSNTSTGTAVIDLTNAAWAFDMTHSSIGFNFVYDAANAPFYGQFGIYSIDELMFDEANPTSSSLKMSLDMTSVETGSPTPDGGHARDGINGCIAGTLGVTFKANADLATEDTTALGAYTLTAITNESNMATFVSTSVAAYGDGYVATGDLSFNGSTAEVKYFFKYIEGFQAEKSGKVYQYSSLHGFFKMDALADFGVESGHVADEIVTVVANIQLKKTL